MCGQRSGTKGIRLTGAKHAVEALGWQSLIILSRTGTASGTRLDPVVFASMIVLIPTVDLLRGSAPTGRSGAVQNGGEHFGSFLKRVLARPSIVGCWSLR
jgi:hypothetical protein